MADKQKKKFYYGGQAVIEGVMMRGPKDFAVAVRRANGEIVTKNENLETIFGKFKWLNKPFLRGTLALIDSMALGIKALKFSSDIAMADATVSDAAVNTDDGADVAPAVEAAGVGEAVMAASSNKVNDITVSLMMVLGLVLGLLLFVAVPIAITKHFASGAVGWQKTAIAGGIKMVLLLAYVSGISLMKDIRRVYQYHGAEHKTINAYEAGEELTVENVMKYTKVHVRCGTSFLLIVVFTSIAVFMFLGWQNILQRIFFELLLMPVVAGISYEIIRFAGGRKNSWITKIVLGPGLLMQKITTREPEPGMVEVAIRSLQGVLDREAAQESLLPGN